MPSPDPKYFLEAYKKSVKRSQKPDLSKQQRVQALNQAKEAIKAGAFKGGKLPTLSEKAARGNLLRQYKKILGED